MQVDEKLPITIVVPLQEHRREFFEKTCLPSLKDQNVENILIITDYGSAPYKRNLGLELVNTEYVFFCDDDIVLPSGYLLSLWKTLISTANHIGYAYTDYKGIVLDSNCHPIGNTFIHNAKHFNREKLIRGNYISTMSLIKTKYSQKFDESLPRLQDWDLWLNLLSNNIHGVYNPTVRFTAYYMDQGITSKGDNAFYNNLKKTILKKYNF